MFAYLISLLSGFFRIILGISTHQNNFPPPLSPEREDECFRLAAKGDEAARQELILHNLRLVSHIVRKYYSSSRNEEDLISVGSIGLIKAVDSFRLDNGTRFATYAAKCIQNEILMCFRSQKKLASEISINETIDVDRDGNPLTYIDIICCEDGVCDDVDEKMQIVRALSLVKTSLTVREREIITMRYGVLGQKPLTQREVADKLKISRSYVSRIEKAALEKLKRLM